MWQTREPDEDRGDARRTARRSTSSAGGPRPRRSSGSPSCVEETGRTFVHPFDDPLVIAGQGTVGLEMLEDVPDARRRSSSRSAAAGSISGIATAVKGCARTSASSASSPSSRRRCTPALAAGEPVPVEPRSIADGLSAPFAGEHCVARLPRPRGRVVLVSEDEIEEAFRFLYERAKLACEPAGAAATAALLAGKSRSSSRARRSSPSSPEATWRPKRPLLSWLER